MKPFLHRCSAYIARHKTAVRPRQYPNAGFDELPANEPIEEETAPNYDPSDYYPVHINEFLHGKYQVVAKLGFRPNSTVWLCRDLSANRLCTVNVYRINYDISCQIDVSNRVNTTFGFHPGRQSIQTAIDSFQVSTKQGIRHDCLVFDTLGLSYAQLQNASLNRRLSYDLLYRCSTAILYALDFLHHIGIVHTDVSLHNIHLGIDHKAELAKIEAAEIAHPSPRKVLSDRTIYSSQAISITVGTPVLCNFATAQLGTPGQLHDAPGSAKPHCAPEMILAIGWDSKVDIWSIGSLMWHLVTGKPLFRSRNDEPVDKESYLAEIVSLLGPPPAELLTKSAISSQYWDAKGTWIAATPIPQQSFETLETGLEESEAAIFLRFMRRVMRWVPEERPAALDHFTDDFLVKCIRAKLTTD